MNEVFRSIELNQMNWRYNEIMNVARFFFVTHNTLSLAKSSNNKNNSESKMNVIKWKSVK